VIIGEYVDVAKHLHAYVNSIIYVRCMFDAAVRPIKEEVLGIVVVASGRHLGS